MSSELFVQDHHPKGWLIALAIWSAIGLLGFVLGLLIMPR